MPLQTMYAPKAFSPETFLTQIIGAADTRIFVDDVSVFPDAPNYATLGTDSEGETVLYTAKGANYIDVQRAAAGTAKEWGIGTIIARKFTAQDLAALQANITELNANKVESDADASEMTVTFEDAEARSNIASGDKFSVIVAKIKKYFADLGALAYKGSVATGDIANSAVDNSKMAQMPAKTIKGNDGTGAANAKDLTLIETRALLNVGDGANDTLKTLNSATPVTEIADTEKIAIVVNDTTGKSILYSAFKTLLGNLFAGKTHAHAGTDITSGTISKDYLPDATTAAKGAVQLNDTVISTSAAQAATANAVKTVNDKAVELQNERNILVASGSTANVYEVTDATVMAYVEGLKRTIKLHADGTAISVKINALATVPVYSSTGKAANGKAGQIVVVCYVGTNFFTVASGESGGDGLPEDWTEEVTAEALENITTGDAIEYCMYPGTDAFNGSEEVYSIIPKGIKYSRDGNIRAFINNSDTTKVVIQKKINGNFTTVFNAVTNTNSYANNAVEVSSDGKYVFCSASSSSGKVSVLKGNADNSAYTNVYEFTPHGYGSSYGTNSGLKLSKDDIYLAVALQQSSGSSYVSQCIVWYKWNKDLNSATQCTSTGAPTSSSSYQTLCYSIDCDDAGIYWIYLGYESNNKYQICLAKRTGDSFATILKGTSLSVANSPFAGCAFKPDGSGFACGYYAYPYIRTFSWINEVATRFTDPVVALGNTLIGVSYANPLQYTPNGLHLVCAHANSPYVTIYKTDTNPYVKLANPSVLPSLECVNVSIIGDGSFVSVEKSTPNASVTNYITGVKEVIMKMFSLKQARQLMPDIYSFNGVGMAKNTVAAGEQCTAMMFKKINDAGV